MFKHNPLKKQKKHHHYQQQQQQNLINSTWEYSVVCCRERRQFQAYQHPNIDWFPPLVQSSSGRSQTQPSHLVEHASLYSLTQNLSDLHQSRKRFFGNKKQNFSLFRKNITPEWSNLLPVFSKCNILLTFTKQQFQASDLLLQKYQ